MSAANTSCLHLSGTDLSLPVKSALGEFFRSCTSAHVSMQSSCTISRERDVTTKAPAMYYAALSDCMRVITDFSSAPIFQPALISSLRVIAVTRRRTMTMFPFAGIFVAIIISVLAQRVLHRNRDPSYPSLKAPEWSIHALEKGLSGPPSTFELLEYTGLRIASIIRHAGHDGWQSCLRTCLISLSVRPKLVSLLMRWTSLARDRCHILACSKGAAFLIHTRRLSTRCSSLFSLAYTSTMLTGTGVAAMRIGVTCETWDEAWVRTQ